MHSGLQRTAVFLLMAWGPALYGGQPKAGQASTTSTEWRDDEKNLIVVGELNRCYARMPFSREYEGVLDDRPFRLDWKIGANVPVAWKGGVAGMLGDRIALIGGLWMPGRKNLAYAYDIATGTYRKIPPPPFETAYTQGVCDGRNLYVVGGRSAGRNAARLNRTADGEWKWTALPALPESEEKGRWLATVNIISGKWLFLCSGHPTGTPSEVRDGAALSDWRLRLDKPEARWERMASYPGGVRSLVISGVLRGKLYVFGGSLTDPVLRSTFVKLSKEYGLGVVPYNGVPNYRDAYYYDPDADAWRPIRPLPFPVIAGSAVALKDRYLLLMGSADVRTYRVGKIKAESKSLWTGYGDVVLCYDVEKDNYSRAGVMPYGVATCPWVTDGKRVYGFGGEPAHGYNQNTENVLQIGTIQEAR